MISNHDVKVSFQKMLDLPDVITALTRLNSRPNRNYRLDTRVNLQIQRGMDPHSWEGAPKGGCSQCVALFCDFDVVPKYCFDCYKILIELDTVVDLFKLLLVFERITLPRDNTRKCMVDPRPIGPVKYKGFVYCRTIEEANELLHIVREAVSADISPEVTVNVKRGCTEYAQKYPEYAQIDSDKDNFKYKEDWQFYENFVDKYWIIEDNVDFDKNINNVDPMRELFAIQYWLRYAASIGDRSYLILTGGKTLEPLPS